jgi:hypothetical protein
MLSQSWGFRVEQNPNCFPQNTTLKFRARATFLFSARLYKIIVFSPVHLAAEVRRGRPRWTARPPKSPSRTWSTTGVDLGCPIKVLGKSQGVLEAPGCLGDVLGSWTKGRGAQFEPQIKVDIGEFKKNSAVFECLTMTG